MYVRLLATAALLLTLCSMPGVASAATYTAGPSDDVESMIGALVAGDELVLADGMYTITERFSFDINGTESEPIVIRAAEGATPHFNRPNASQNIWDIQASYVELRGLTFSGGSAGLRFERGSFVTIEDCEVFDTADVAIRMNDGGQTYDGMRILRNHVHDTGGTGEGMYLGCNNDGCRLANSLIEGNYVHHTDASDVSQGDGIEIKEGGHDNVVRDNVIHDTNYPCILTYAAAGNGGPNIIERNVMWNCGDHGIQTAADATIRNNIILSANSNGIAFQPHQSGAPANLIVVHNTVIAPNNDAMSLRGTEGSVVVANNALYAQSGSALRVVGGSTAGLVVAGNVGMGTWDPSDGFTVGTLADFVSAGFGGAPPMDVFPAAAGGLVGTGSAAHIADDDFDGRSRAGAADVGAYAYGTAGAGWVLAEMFKPMGTTAPMMDGGMPDVDAGPRADSGLRADSGPTRDSGPTADAGPGGEPDPGCSCRAVGGQRGATPWGLLVSVALALAWRRRRDTQR